ncbi:MAG TPA: hypothetical protein PK360_09765 [bacterium]|nr:hypothetical protein [bacterium]
MNGSWELNHVLDTLAKILIRCFIVGIIFMLVPFLFYVTNRSVVYSLHSQWFHMTMEQVDWMMYASLGITEILVFFVFLFPYIAIRLTLPRK